MGMDPEPDYTRSAQRGVDVTDLHAESVARGAPALSAEQQAWIEAAWDQVDEPFLAKLVASMTDIPSPTGAERPLAEFLVQQLMLAGLESRYQAIDELQGNALGWLAGSGGGADLLLYAPTDTHIAGNLVDDGPWAGPARPDLQPHAAMQEHAVIGLGAENPKSYGACILTAARAVRMAGIPLQGNLRVGLCAGGMPSNGPPSARRHNLGQGSGCSFMLEQGFRGDYAIIAKPGWAVAWEEVGLCWFKVSTRGAFNYTGIRHFRATRNAIVDMATVIEALEAWFPEYSAAHTSGLVCPQGSIGAIHAGWSHSPAFVPASCELYVDVRISPRTEILDVQRELEAVLAMVKNRHPGLDVSSEMILAIPGTTTHPDSWIVRSAIRGWEGVTLRPHVPPKNQSGATDANVLRAWGVPTARIGQPRSGDLPYSSEFSMGVADTAGMVELTKVLIHTVVDTCTRPINEVNLKVAANG